MATSVRSSFRRGVLSVWVVLALTATVGAEMISVRLGGEVTSTSFPFGAGATVTGLYTYDSTLSPSSSDLNIAWYSPVTATVSFVDGASVSTVSTDEAYIMVNNNSSGIGSTDVYGVGLDIDRPSPGTLTGEFAGREDVSGWILARQDPTGTTWDAVTLPNPEIILTRLPGDASVLFFHDPSGELQYVQFEITDLSVVPLPGALWLGVLGLGCCHRLWRGRTM